MLFRMITPRISKSRSIVHRKGIPEAVRGENRWRCVFIELEQRFASANDITEDEAREWSRQLVTAKRKARTVNDVRINAARTIFGWAKRERFNQQQSLHRLESNRAAARGAS